MANSRKSIPISITTPTTGKRIPLLKAPSDNTWTIESAVAVPDTDLAAGTVAFALTLENGGASGTAQTAISDVVGGTAGWTANTPKTFTITAGAGDLTADQYLNAFFDASNTPSAVRLTIVLEVSEGLGAKG